MVSAFLGNLMEAQILNVNNEKKAKKKAILDTNYDSTKKNNKNSSVSPDKTASVGTR